MPKATARPKNSCTFFPGAPRNTCPNRLQIRSYLIQLQRDAHRHNFTAPAFFCFTLPGAPRLFWVYHQAKERNRACRLPAGACSRWPPGSSPAMQVRDAAILSILAHSAPVPGLSTAQATHASTSVRATSAIARIAHQTRPPPHATLGPRAPPIVLSMPRWLHSIVCPVGAGGLRERLHGSGIVPRRRVRVPAGLDLL